MALAVSPMREYRSPIVFATVRSLSSCLRIFSYSAMAFCSLPCCTNFSAALRTFCLLKPKPNAIGLNRLRKIAEVRSQIAEVKMQIVGATGTEVVPDLYPCGFFFLQSDFLLLQSIYFCG